YAPIVSDWSNFETWQENGRKTAARRAHALYQEVLENYTPPPLDPGVREHLEAYVAKRRTRIKPGW
ncbi:MAG: trimethylamine methyltransferase family protein, partial [Gammaproteobacteria bacterium]|nr:trimethylamine methyltransferase family protein [Gammaproteobacteria bacterium]